MEFSIQKEELAVLDDSISLWHSEKDFWKNFASIEVLDRSVAAETPPSSFKEGICSVRFRTEFNNL